MLPKSSQLDAKIVQESPTCGQDRPESSPRASNQTPQDPKIDKNAVFSTFAIFPKIAPKTTKNAQDSSPSGLKMATWAPTWPILAPSWLQLGAIMGHLGDILVVPSPAKIDQKSAKTAFENFFVPRSPLRPPRPPPDLDFSSFWDHVLDFLVFFQSTFRLDSVSKILIFQARLL